MEKDIRKRKSHTGLKLLAAFCVGVAVGFLCAPAKNGIGNNNGNTTNHYHWSGDDEFPIPDSETETAELESDAE